MAAVTQSGIRVVQPGEKPASLLSEGLPASSVICLDLKEGSDSAVEMASDWIRQARAIEIGEPNRIVPCLVVRGDTSTLKADDIARLISAGAVLVDQADDIPHQVDPDIDTPGVSDDSAEVAPLANDLQVYVDPPYKLAPPDYEEWLQRMRQSPGE